MSTAASPRTGSLERGSLTGRSWALLALALALLIGSLYSIWRHVRQPSGIAYETRENRPLLRQGAVEFRDNQVGIRFNPPSKWSMQLLSKEAPTHSSDRLLVKYKRLLPESTVAWFRVNVVDVPEEQSIVDSVKNRAPGHDGWTPRGEVTTLTVGGLPAAKMRYTGAYNGFPSYRDVVGVRRGGQVFFFVTTYRLGDSTSQQEAAQAMQSVLFESQ